MAWILTVTNMQVATVTQHMHTLRQHHVSATVPHSLPFLAVVNNATSLFREARINAFGCDHHASSYSAEKSCGFASRKPKQVEILFPRLPVIISLDQGGHVPCRICGPIRVRCRRENPARGLSPSPRPFLPSKCRLTVSPVSRTKKLLSLS